MTACHHVGGGWGERVDVPLSVAMKLTGTPLNDCHGSPPRCAIRYKATVTNEGAEAVYARDCSARALDGKGHVVAESLFGFGIGPGGYTAPGEPYRVRGSLDVGISPREQSRVKSIEGTCLAYIWHGTVPI
jgi:hypothetical protein